MSYSKRVIDLTGQRRGRLVVLSMHPGKRNTGSLALCRCDCGNLRLVPSRSLRHYPGRQATACVACSLAASRARSAETNRRDRSIKLRDGRTIGQIAAIAGLKVNTVLIRHRRGWPDWRLGETTRRAP